MAALPPLGIPQGGLAAPPGALRTEPLARRPRSAARAPGSRGDAHQTMDTGVHLTRLDDGRRPVLFHGQDHALEVGAALADVDQAMLQGLGARPMAGALVQ